MEGGGGGGGGEGVDEGTGQQPWEEECCGIVIAFHIVLGGVTHARAVKTTAQ